MWVCLQHATLPRWFTDDLRGFRDDKVGRYRWSAHVDQCAEAFGDLVDGWQPMESPSRYALEGFLFGRLPPGRTDVREFPGVLATVHQAAADAARLLAGSGVPVASSHWLAPLRPATPAAEEFLWEAWAVPELVEPFDLLGVTANAPVRADPDPTDDEDEDRFVLTGEPEPSREQVADGVAEVIGRLTELFPDMPLLVRGTELAVEDETRRADHVESLLGAVSAAIEAGADVQGYFHWAAVDGYELDGGFATKRGLFDRDRNARGSLESLATARDM
jgi:beta-glucosidase